MSDTLGIKAYGVLTRVIAPALPLYLKRRAKAGKEDANRMNERFGHASLPRPEGSVIWLHGASVGETTMLLPLIDRILENPDSNVLLTSGTVTSAKLMAERLPTRAIHQFIPIDTPGAVTRFLDHWKPDAALWAESEIWPNLIRLTKRRGIPLALINARMSAGSITRWKKHGIKNARSVFGNFDKILAANAQTAEGLADVLGHDIPILGNLKDAAPPLPVNEADLKTLGTQIWKRPVWCAASTHQGEEQLFLSAHAKIREAHPTALLILALRHPERRAEVMPLIKDKFAARSEASPITKDTSILLLDTIGEMGLAYRLSHVTFIAGSTQPSLSGHNPLEPARLDNALITGPYVSSFQSVYEDMFEDKAVIKMSDMDKLAGIICEFFDQPKTLTSAQKRARDFAQSRKSVLDDVWTELTSLMPKAKS